jgi:hypothetical protein
MRAAHALLAVPLTLVAVVAPVEVTIENGDGGPAVPLVISGPTTPASDREHCTAVLRAATIKTNPGCTLDERISHGNGTLHYPCNGDGPVEAVFGEHHFLGNVTETSVALTLGTELDWEDGCHWETKQAMIGSNWRREGSTAHAGGVPNAPNGPTAKKRAPHLVWSYSEAPVSGTNCYGSCTATADIEVVLDDDHAKPSP